MNASEIRKAILSADLTVEEIRDLTEALKLVRTVRGQDNINSLRAEARVKWVNRNKSVEFGTVKKVARTTVTVLSDNDSQLWRIPASMLQAA
jgi:hypothetical protein